MVPTCHNCNTGGVQLIAFEVSAEASKLMKVSGISSKAIYRRLTLSLEPQQFTNILCLSERCLSVSFEDVLRSQ